jgi:hypothetical protein
MAGGPEGPRDGSWPRPSGGIRHGDTRDPAPARQPGSPPAGPGQPAPWSQVSPRPPGGGRAGDQSNSVPPRPAGALPPSSPRRSSRRPRITPTRFFLVVAVVGSIAYLGWAITVRDPSQLPMLSAGAAVLGIVFAAIALAGAVEVVRSARRGQGGRSFLAALFGGIAAMIALGCFAAAVVLAELS